MDPVPTGPANARLAAIVGSSDDAIIGQDLSGRITDWNRGAERLFGYTAEEALGRHVSMMAFAGGEAEMVAILERIARGEVVDHFDAHRRRKDGAGVEVSLAISPIRDSEGQIVGASTIARDVTEQKRLLSEKGLLAAIVESSDDLIISKNLNGIITSWNAAAEKILGYTAEEAVGRHITLIAPAGREHEMQQIIQRIKRGERVAHFETQRRRKDGGLVDLSLTVSPIYDGDGNVVGASKIARDISERQQAEERLKLLLRELDHRAKNVLAIAQAMLRLTRAETVEGYIQAVEGRIQALARVHGQVAENRWDGAALRALVESEIDIVSGRRMTAEGPHVWVSPSAAQVLGIVLHELTTNAAKHGALSSAKGRVRVGWEVDGNGDLHLFWREGGGPIAGPPTRRGFGTQVIEQSVGDQLSGQSRVRWEPAGLECDFAIPGTHLVRPTGAKARL